MNDRQFFSMAEPKKKQHYGPNPRRFAPFGIAPCRQSHMSKPCHGGALAAFPKITSRRRRSGLSRDIFVLGATPPPLGLVPQASDLHDGMVHAVCRIPDPDRAEI